MPVDKYKVWITKQGSSVSFDAEVTGISTVGDPTERDKGLSTMRFRLEGKDAIAEQPLGFLSELLEANETACLLMASMRPIDGCKIRECSLDLSSRVLNVQLYLPIPVQQVRGWFYG